MRNLSMLLALALVACSQAQSATPAPSAPRNFVCERIAIKNPTAKCDAEESGEGPNRLHRARVTIGADTVSCGITDGSLAVVCDGLFATAQQPQAPQPAPQTEPKK